MKLEIVVFKSTAARPQFSLRINKASRLLCVDCFAVMVKDCSIQSTAQDKCKVHLLVFVVIQILCLALLIGTLNNEHGEMVTRTTIHGEVLVRVQLFDVYLIICAYGGIDRLASLKTIFLKYIV